MPVGNNLYPKWKRQLFSFAANNNLSAGTVKVALVDTSSVGSYSYNFNDEFYEVAGSTTDVQSNTVGTPVTLTNKQFTAISTGGNFDADDVLFTAVTGNSVEALVIYIDTGNNQTSPLVAYIDTLVTGLPVTPNGGNITITWNASGIFTL
jgi:hypothetical protein